MARKTHPRRGCDWLPSALLLALTAAAYSRIGSLRFVSIDDPAYVTQNSHVLGGITRESIRWAFTAFHSANWHPLTWLSHLLDVQAYGLHPLGHHLTSMIFHAANVLLLFVLLNRLTRSKWRSVFVAGLFAVHPLHVESVAWVAERKDVLSGFFFFLTLLAYVGYVKRPSGLRYGAVCAALALGLMAKPMLVSVPLVLLMLDYWPLGRSISWGLVREKLPLFGLALASCVVTFIAQRHGGAVQSFDQYPFGVRLANGAVVYIAYLVKMLWPVKLSVLYPHPGPGLPAWQVVVSALLMVAITYWVVRFARKVPYVAVGWFWYVVTLIPVIGLIQVGKQAMADRYTYIPLTGVFVALTWAVADLASRLDTPTRKLALASAGTAVLGALTVLTFTQTGYWRSGVRLFRHAVAVTPGNYMIHYCLADAYLEEHNPRLAIPELRETLRLKPDQAAMHDVLGFALTKQGNTQEGLKEIRTALRLDPRLATAWNNLGGIYTEQGKSEEAIRYFEKAVKIKPDYAEARFNLGAAFDGKGLAEKAKAQYLAALDADPGFAPALCAMGSLMFRKGNYHEAEGYLRKATRTDPNLADAQLLLGATLVQQGKAQEALGYLARVIRSRPKWAAGHYYMSLTLCQQGAYAEAQDELRTAVRYGWKPDPRFVEALESRLRDK